MISFGWRTHQAPGSACTKRPCKRGMRERLVAAEFDGDEWYNLRAAQVKNGVASRVYLSEQGAPS
jgi:hypothetical protein